MQNHVISWVLLLDITWLILLTLILRNFLIDIRTLRTVSQWPQTQGKVESMELVETEGSYWPKLCYQYQVNDVEYSGKNIFLDSILNAPHKAYSKRVAHDIAKAYQQDEEVTVYYDPQHAELSVLNTRVPPKLYVIASILGLLIAGHLGFIAYKVLY